MRLPLLPPSDRGERGTMDCEEEKKKSEFHKTMECVKCKHLFDCKGKPREVESCLNFEERVDIR